MDKYEVTDRRRVGRGDGVVDGVVAAQKPRGDVLVHRFAQCSTCGTEHMVIGDEKFDPAKHCPRSVANGWQWTTGYGIGYGPAGRDDARRQLDPGGTTDRTNNLSLLGKLIGYQGG